LPEYPSDEIPVRGSARWFCLQRERDVRILISETEGKAVGKGEKEALP
jgi:hypothetical protein